MQGLRFSVSPPWFKRGQGAFVVLNFHLSLQSTGRAGTNLAVFSIPSKNHLLLKTQCSLHGSVRNGFLLHLALWHLIDMSRVTESGLTCA